VNPGEQRKKNIEGVESSAAADLFQRVFRGALKLKRAVGWRCAVSEGSKAATRRKAEGLSGEGGVGRCDDQRRRPKFAVWKMVGPIPTIASIGRGRLRVTFHQSKKAPHQVAGRQTFAAGNGAQRLNRVGSGK